MQKQVDFLDDLFSSLQKPTKKIKKVQKTPKVIKSSLLKEAIAYETTFHSQDLYKQHNFIESSQKGTDFLEKSLKNPAKFEQKITNKSFLIQKFVPPLKYPEEKQKPSQFFQNTLKQREIHKIPQNFHSYALYQPLHTLWQSYISSQIEDIRNEEELYLNVLKCDFHGAKIGVIEGAHQGYEGIVIQETLRSFVCVSQEGVKRILKEKSVFLVWLGGEKIVKIFGCHLLIRPSHRAKHKFKAKDVNPFLLGVQL